ncbi:MAG: osmotic-shock protein [Proteobacteria bacterium ST_bin13]|uniref:YggT family protein n=1 Tax=Sphingomonas sp. 28-62-20 TaxID=1970433 RepID=UPI000A0DA7A6|nr:MAG: osmotic-shock protein [Proteobacteria bacterium ST_bin13]
MITLIQIAMVLLNLVWWVVVVQIVLSLLISFNVINTYNDFVRSLYQGLDKLTEPMYRPIRKVLPDFGQIDFSPAVILIGLQIGQLVLGNVAASIATGAPL